MRDRKVQFAAAAVQSRTGMPGGPESTSIKELVATRPDLREARLDRDDAAVSAMSDSAFSDLGSAKVTKGHTENDAQQLAIPVSALFLLQKQRRFPM